MDSLLSRKSPIVIVGTGTPRFTQPELLNGSRSRTPAAGPVPAARPIHKPAGQNPGSRLRMTAFPMPCHGSATYFWARELRCCHIKAGLEPANYETPTDPIQTPPIKPERIGPDAMRYARSVLSRLAQSTI
jgi:hypothetical protein